MITISTIKTQHPLVSVIIVNYNGIRFVERCLNSVLRSNYPNFEVIFFDNTSTDGSVEFVRKNFCPHPRVKIIQSSKNIGLGNACNVCAEKAEGKYLLFLDVDTEVDSNCMDEIVKVMEENSDIGAGQCELLLMNDKVTYQSVGIFLDSLGFGYVRGAGAHKGTYDRVFNVFSAVGAALFIRSNTFREVGGFDKDFFILNEEIDLCWKVWLAGYRVVFVPNATVYHNVGYASSKIVKTKFVYLTYRNWILSKFKNYGLFELVKCLPLYTLLLLGYGFINIRKSYLQAIISAVLYNFVHLRRTWRKRLNIQRIRKLSDKELIKKGVIWKFDMRRALSLLGKYRDTS